MTTPRGSEEHGDNCIAEARKADPAKLADAVGIWASQTIALADMFDWAHFTQSEVESIIDLLIAAGQPDGAAFVAMAWWFAEGTDDDDKAGAATVWHDFYLPLFGEEPVDEFAEVAAEIVTFYNAEEVSE